MLNLMGVIGFSNAFVDVHQIFVTNVRDGTIKLYHKLAKSKCAVFST